MSDQTESDPLGLACEHGVDPRACEVCFAAMLRELDSHPGSGRLMHASPKAESASENAGLLRIHDRVGKWGAAFDSEPMQTAKATAAAIRALEAKLAVERRIANAWSETAEKFRGERDRLAGEVERLEREIDADARELQDICNALPGVAFMDPPDGGSVSIAEQVRRMYAALQSQDAEVARLVAELLVAQTRTSEVTSELAAARENEARYLWLREHGDFGCTEKDGYGGQQLMIGERLDTAVDAARRADGASEAGSIRQSWKGEV